MVKVGENVILIDVNRIMFLKVCVFCDFALIFLVFITVD